MFFEWFLDIIYAIGNMVSENLLTIIAVSMLGALVIYELVMTIVIFRMKKKRRCHCNITQINNSRRWAVLIVAWLFAGFALLNLLPYNVPVGEIPLSHIMLPFAFLVLFHVIELFFMILTRTKCRCDCCDSSGSSKQTRPAKNQKTMHEQPHYQQHQPEPHHQVQPAYHQEQPIVHHAPPPPPAPIPVPMTAHAPKQPRPQPRTIKPPPAQHVESHGAHLEEKIEYQRSAAAPNANASQNPVEDRANKMGELQRRMESLRQTVNKKETTTTTTATATSTRSVTELRQEQESLMRQYETLQKKLVQMKEDERRADVGYFSGENNFERTGKPEHLSKLPSRNKFDEEEVKTALLGLKHAMDSLQSQIDAHEERPTSHSHY